MKDKLLQIINHYGVMKQLKYIHSEYFELDEAIINLENSAFKSRFLEEEAKHIHAEFIYHIAEEIADVMVMLKQFQYYYGFPDSYIENIMNQKIDRQIERIENE